MELDACVSQRRSFRKFIDKPVSSAYLAKIIKAATYAPTAGNQQEWRFIVVTDDKKKEKIAHACEEQLWVANAGALFIVCTDNRDIERFYGERGRGYAIQDAAAAAENMLLKATDMGLASCWIAAFDEDELRGILSLPLFVIPQMIIALGYSEEKPVEKYTFKAEDIVHYNQYGKKAADYPELGEIIKNLVEKGKKTIKKLRHA